MSQIRTEFGFERTACACSECAINCRFIPGYLIPADLDRIAGHLSSENLIEFALENLLASPGATVVDRDRVRQIPTLVPTRRGDGACKFLDANNRCTIHEVSPFGCAFFDAHQSKTESDYRSGSGLVQIDRAWHGDRLYARLWLLLRTLGKVGPSPVAARARLQQALAARKEMSSNE